MQSIFYRMGGASGSSVRAPRPRHSSAHKGSLFESGWGLQILLAEEEEGVQVGVGPLVAAAELAPIGMATQGGAVVSLPAAGFRTPGATQPTVAPLQEVLVQIRQHITAPLLPMPNVQQKNRHRKLFIPEEDKRRSVRLAEKSKGKPGTCIKSAQRVLMAKLGICDIVGEAPVDCLERHAQYFIEPLPPSQIEALTKLFFLDASMPEELFMSV